MADDNEQGEAPTELAPPEWQNLSEVPPQQAPDWHTLSDKAPEQPTGGPTELAPQQNWDQGHEHPPNWHELSDHPPSEQPTTNDPRNPYGESTQPSSTALGVGAREFARGIIPTAAGAIAGVGAGLLAVPSAPFTFGAGPVAAGLGGAFVGAGVARKVQDEIADTLGLDSPEARASDVAQHPTAALVGGLAPAVVAFQPGQIAGSVAQRGGAAAILGGVNLAQQGLEKGFGNIDPTEVAASAATGALLPNARGYVNRAAGAGLGAIGAEAAAARAVPPAAAAAQQTSQARSGVDPTIQAATDALKSEAAPPPPAQPAPAPPAEPPAPAAEPPAPAAEPPAPAAPAAEPPARPAPLIPEAQGAPPVSAERFRNAAVEGVTPGERNELGFNNAPTGNLRTPERLQAYRAAQENGAPEVGGQNENEAAQATPAEDEAIAAMKPQSLSGAATEGENNFTPGETAKAKSTIGDLWKKLTRPWNTAMAPENLNEETRLFGLAVRGSQAETNRFRAQGDQAREEFDAAINKLPVQYHDNAARNFQTGTISPDNPISRIAKPMFDQQAKIQAKLDELDPEGTWQQQHLPTLFADPVSVRNQILDWTTPVDEGGQGRKGPFTIGDVMDAGFKLAPGNLDAKGNVRFPQLLDNLHNSQDNYIEAKGIAQKAFDDGIVSKVQRPGDKPLDGLTLGGSRLWAQPGVATMWDRYSPSAMDQSSKSFLEKAQKIKNAGTSWQLMLGLYHLFAETGEAMNGDVMGAVSEAASGRFGKAGKQLAQAPMAPIRQATKSATQALEAYYTPEKATSQGREDMQDLIAGGLTASRIQRYTPDLNTAGRNFWTAWGKAAARGDFEPMQRDFAEKGERIKNAYGEGVLKGTGQAAGEVFRTLGEAMQTTMHPMFNVYIPRLKIGAAWEQMRAWKDANPDAKPAERAEVAKKILKSIDDRLGEMNQSTLFWNKALQRAANLAFISPGWETGTVRAAIGGLTSAIKNPKSLAITGGTKFQPNAAFPLAFGITTAVIGSVYEFLKTGKPPVDVQHAFFPSTGGNIQGKPEQAILPGYLKDVYSWWGALAGHDSLPASVSKSLYNKLALVPHAVWDTMANKDWAGHQIYNPSAPTREKLQQYLQYVHDEMRPIGIQQVGAGQKGSNISAPERTFGVKKAPQPWEGQDAANNKAQKATETARARQQSKIEGNPDLPKAEKAKRKSKQRKQPQQFDEGGVVQPDPSQNNPDPQTQPAYTAPTGEAADQGSMAAVTPTTSGMWSDEDEARLQATNTHMEHDADTRGFHLGVRGGNAVGAAINRGVRGLFANYAEGGPIPDLNDVSQNADWDKFENAARPSENVEDVRSSNPLKGAAQVIQNFSNNLGETLSGQRKLPGMSRGGVVKQISRKRTAKKRRGYDTGGPVDENDMGPDSRLNPPPTEEIEEWRNETQRQKGNPVDEPLSDRNDTFIDRSAGYRRPARRT